jgi:hypothetical protein
MKKIILGISILVIGSVALAQLPDPGFKVDDKTAVLVTDPQIDFLSPDGVTWVARHGHGVWNLAYSSFFLLVSQKMAAFKLRGICFVLTISL